MNYSCVRAKADDSQLNLPNGTKQKIVTKKTKTTRNVGQCPTANVMAALPNTGGAVCSTPQCGCAVMLPRPETR